MKRITKKIILGMLIGTMVFATTACGDDNTSTEETSETTHTETTIEETTTEETTETATTEEEVASVDLFADTGLPTFELTSEDLHDGVWDSVISDLEGGQNVSPQLSWEPVPDATSYVIYMVDTSAGNWMHWKVNGVTETTLPQGWASEEQYIGPYPPGGTHIYEIYVFALKQPVEKAKGTLNSRTDFFTKYAMELDAVEEGASGNIISYGYLSGTYTREN